MVDADETKIDTETTTDEKIQDADNSDDAENLDKKIEDETDLPESSAKENIKNWDNLSVNNDKKQNVKKVNGAGMAKGFITASIAAITVTSATSVINRLVKSSGTKKESVSPVTTELEDAPVQMIIMTKLAKQHLQWGGCSLNFSCTRCFGVYCFLCKSSRIYEKIILKNKTKYYIHTLGLSTG